MWIALHTWAVWLPKMEELCRMSRNEKQMALSYNSIQCRRIAEYLLGPYFASFVVILSRCCYMDLRHGKKWKLSPHSCRPSLTPAYEESWTSIGRKWFQTKNFGEGQPEVISNEEFWRRTEEIEMSMQIKRRKRKWIGHTLRKGNEAIEREALDWKPQGKRRRGRPRHTWRRTVNSEALEKGKSWNEVKRVAGNRTRWRCFVEALCPLRDDGNWRWWWVASGPVWTGAKNVALTGIRSPDRPARSESLYRVSCPDRRLEMYIKSRFEL